VESLKPKIAKKGRQKMARLNRQLVSAEFGGYHIISRVAGGDFLFKAEDKDYFLNLLRRFVAGYFVQLHSFAIMSNHFHLLVTVSEEASAKADSDELAHRLWTVNKGEFRKRSDEENRQKMGMKHVMLQETGKEKARERLSSISRFTQDLKQSFARYFNEKHQRLGCLWGGRFRGVIISHGTTQLACSAYVDLNPIRAGMVQKPEDYHWCSLGLIKKAPKTAKYLLTPVQMAATEQNPWEWYKSFVYESGKIGRAQAQSQQPAPQQTTNQVHPTNTAPAQQQPIAKSAEISLKGSSIAQSAKEKCQELQLDGKLINRIRNLSEGLIAGTAKMIASLQDKLQRQPREPKEIWEGSPFFTTRVFHQPRLSV
jgi:REP element-mobilizing transposase RayT